MVFIVVIKFMVFGLKCSQRSLSGNRLTLFIVNIIHADSRTVQGDCDPLDRLMLGVIVTPLTLPDGDCNPKGLQSPSGHTYTPLAMLYNLACL